MDNPLAALIPGLLPECDFAVLQHGFAPHGRDYIFIIQTGSGTHELTFTHTVSQKYITRVADEHWLRVLVERVYRL